jgi:hypothetical protein
MKHLTSSLCIGAAALLLPAAAQAKYYAGFDLCTAATPAILKNVIEGAGGTVGRVIDKTYPDEIVVIARNYPVEVSPRSVAVTLYKGQIVYISIGNAGDMVPAIEAKYGSNFTTSRKEEKVGITNSHHYTDPTDPALELSISQFEVANNKGSFFSVNYACKDVYQHVEAAREAYTQSNLKK